MDQLEQDLGKLPLPVRVAVAAASAERVLDIYKYASQVESVLRGPRLAVDAAWSFALGEKLDVDHIEQVRAEVNRAFPHPDLGGGPDHFAVGAAAYALDTIQDKTARSARLALGRARDAVEEIDEEDGVEEEKVWQNRAVQIAKQWDEAPIRRDMFASLGSEKPRWRLRME